MKKKCHHCGLKHSVKFEDVDLSNLVMALGPTDYEGLQMYLIYCQSCKHMNIYQPSWIPIKWDFTKCWSPQEITENYISYRTKAIAEDPVLVPKDIQLTSLNNLDLALKADGLI